MSSVAIPQGCAPSSVHVFDAHFKPSIAAEPTPVVFVLHEDSSVSELLERLIRGEGWRSEGFASGEEFLTFTPAVVPNCLLLDVSLSDIDGLSLQKRLAIERPDMPVIFVAGNVDIPTTVRAMKAGAVGLFTKPVRKEALLNSIREALEQSRVRLAREREMRALRDCYNSLSRREREVMALVTSGLLNKQVGGELGISEITVKAHRGQVMQKMKAESLPDLVRFAERLCLTRPRGNVRPTDFGPLCA